VNILFYYTSKEQAVSLSSLMIAFQKQGHQVSLLTHSEEGALHEQVRKFGVKTSSYVLNKNSSFLFYFKHFLFLLSFIKKNKCQIVYSHIQQANIIACFAQYFTSAKVILCRHHSDYAYKGKNNNQKLFDKIINFIGKEFVVPSKKVFDQMVNVEGVRNKKIHLIPYAYNFEEYSKPEAFKVNQIREQYKCSLLLLTIARLIPEKRHYLQFEVINNLIKRKHDIKLIVLGDGIERTRLENYIKENALENSIYLLGHKSNIMDYIAASDMSVLISESEASNSAIKESALQKKTAIVCNDVGDFNEYIQNNVNGFIINKEYPENELEKLLEDIYNKKINIVDKGEKLYQAVFEMFSIDNIIKKYDSINGRLVISD